MESEYSKAFDYLRSISQAFTAQQASARVFIEQLHAVAQRDDIQGLKVVARSPDELLLTLAGIGCYFRFVYTPHYGYIEFGQWATGSAGERNYNSSGRWEISKDGRCESFESSAAEQPMYIALASVMRDIDGVYGPDASSRWKLSRRLLREFDDDANQPHPVVSQSPPAP